MSDDQDAYYEDYGEYTQDDHAQDDYAQDDYAHADYAQDYSQEGGEYKDHTHHTAMAAEYDQWADQWEEKYQEEVDDKRKWVRPTPADVEELPNRRKPPPSPVPSEEPDAPEAEVRFYEPRGNPVETLRSTAEIARAMSSYVDNLSVQEESCREIIRLCKPNDETARQRTHTFSRESRGDATPEERTAAKVAANRPTDTKLSADEAVRLHLIGDIFTAMTRYWMEPVFCGFGFEAIAIIASNNRAKRISVPAESQRALKQIGDGFQSFIGAMDAHHANSNAMAWACESIALLSEQMPTNRDFMVESGAPQAVTNALDSNPRSVEVVVAAARALLWMSKADSGGSSSSSSSSSSTSSGGDVDGPGSKDNSNSSNSSSSSKRRTEKDPKQQRHLQVQQDLRTCKSFPALIAGMACTRHVNPPVTFRAGYRALAQLALNRKSRAQLGNSGAIGILVDGMDMCLELQDLESQIEGLRAIQRIVLGNGVNSRSFILKGGAGIIIRSMSMFRHDSITNTFEACRAFCAVIGMRGGVGGSGGQEADESDERRATDDILYLQQEEDRIKSKYNDDEDEKRNKGITAVDYHTIAAFMNVVVPALASSTPKSSSLFHREGSEAVQNDGMRAVAFICGAGDDRYPSLAVELGAARVIRDGMAEFVHESERVAYEGVRCLGHFATSVIDNHREILVIEEGNAIGCTLNAMTVHLGSKRIQREGCWTIMQLGMESPINSLILADQGFGLCLANALKKHPNSFALSYAVCEAVSVLTGCVVAQANQKWDEIQIEDLDEDEKKENDSKSEGKVGNSSGNLRGNMTAGELKRCQKKMRKKYRLMRDEYCRNVIDGSYLQQQQQQQQKVGATLIESKIESKLDSAIIEESKEVSNFESKVESKLDSAIIEESKSGSAKTEPMKKNTKKEGLVECVIRSLSQFGRTSTLFLEIGIRTLRLLSSLKEHGRIVSASNGEESAIDAISYILEEPREEEEDKEEEEKEEMVYLDGKLVKKEKVELPPRIRTTKIKQGKRECRILEESVELLIHLSYCSEDVRNRINDAGGVSATCAILKVAGANKELHKKCVLLLGIIAASNSMGRDLIFEEEAGELLMQSMKRYGSDHEIVMYGLWAIAASCFSHGSNQTTYAMSSGLETCRKARKKFKSKSNENHAAVRAWSVVAENGIMGRKVDLKCGWWKPKYEEDESVDYDSDAGLPGFRPKEFVKEWVMEAVATSMSEYEERYSGILPLQCYVRMWIARNWKGYGTIKKQKKGKKGKKGKTSQKSGAKTKQKERGRSRERGSTSSLTGKNTKKKKKGGGSKSPTKKNGKKKGRGSKSPTKKKGGGKSKSPSRKSSKKKKK